MAGNSSKIQIEVRVDGKGGIKVLHQIGVESEKTGKKGTKGFKNMGRSVGAFNKRINLTRGLAVKLGAAFAALVVASAYGMKKAIDAASDLQEVQGKFDVVFAKHSKQAEGMAKILVKSYAMSEREAKQYLSSIQDLLVPMGMAANKALLMSNEVVKLSADLASFNNLKTSQVMLDIQSALVGNFETMKKYGVILNEHVVKEKAFEMGLYSGKGMVDANTKALVAYKLILKMSAAAVGDLDRTSDSYANQMKKLMSQIEDMKATIGKELLPEVTKWINQLNTMIEKNPQIIKQMGEFAKNVLDLATAMGKVIALGAEFTNVWVKTFQAMGLASTGMIDLKTAMLDGANAVDTFNEVMGPEKLRLAYLQRIIDTGKYTSKVYWEHKKLTEKIAALSIVIPPSRLEESLLPDVPEPIVSPPKTTPDAKALKDALDLEAKLWEYEVKAAQRADDEIIDAHEAMIEYEKTLYQEAAKNKISMIEKMYSDLKFTSDDYYAYQLNQLQRQSDGYEEFTGNAELAHLWLTEQIKALDKERLEAADKGNQHLIDLSQRTADAMEDNFSSFYRDFFRGELDSAEDYFRKFCHSLTDSFSDMMGQMTKEALFGGGSSGSSGLFGSLLSTGISSFFGGGTGVGGTTSGLGGLSEFQTSGAMFHSGGRVGRDPAPTRNVPASIFANAPRLHEGWPGLKKDEFPSILKYDETVLPPGVKPVNNMQNLTISVPVNIEGQGDDRLASKLSYEMEETAKRVMREEMR